MNGEAPTYYTDKHAMSMTLRDYFAAQAMQGICARAQWSYEAIADTAYWIADAMHRETGSFIYRVRRKLKI